MELTTAMDNVRELAHRSSAGLEVTLLWFRNTNRLVVFVIDERTGDQFEVFADTANALDVFYHPFAYAARSGIDGRTSRQPDREGAIAA
jgi:hypothetical protein